MTKAGSTASPDWKGLPTARGHLTVQHHLSDEQREKMWHIYTMDDDLAMEKNDILPFAVDVESIMLSELSQRKTNTICFSLMYGILKIKQTHKPRDQTSGYQWEEEAGAI